jgi:processive 1,2-diacylglycerol beta-glucosyltransferase
VINYVVPGQEEGNAELLRGMGGGIPAPTPDEVVTVVDRLLGDAGRPELQSMERALGKIARPGAAADVARMILDQVSRAKSVGVGA